MINVSSLLWSLKLYPPMRQLHNFGTKKMSLLFNNIEEESKKWGVSSKHVHPMIIQFLSIDISNCSAPCLNYSRARKIFIRYVTEIVESPSFQEYDPKRISQQGNRISEIVFYLSRYPRFEVDPEHLRKTYRIFCRFISHRTNQEMERALMFALRADPMAGHSVIYEQFLKYYLGEKWEAIKAKYGLDLRNESLGKSVQKIVASVIHRSFLRRTPEVERSLQVCQPSEVLKLVLGNSSTSNSLLIRKVMYQQIFRPTVQYYEEVLRCNLYHAKNIELWERLSQNGDVLFHSCELLQKQTSYLRELYITLFLVLRQQGQQQPICRWFRVVGMAYAHSINLPQSLKAAEFARSVQQFVDSYSHAHQDKLIQFLELDSTIFDLLKYFPRLSSGLMDIIAQKITPLTFYVHFDDLTKCISSWSQGLVQKLGAAHQESMFNLVPPAQCLLLVRELKPQHIEIYKSIIDSIVEKQYNVEPPIEEVIAMLQIYCHHKWLSMGKDDHSNLAVLRVFLFRYLADYKQNLNKGQLRQVVDLILRGGDEDSFSDGNGNYEKNIFQEMENYLTELGSSTSAAERVKLK